MYWLHRSEGAIYTETADKIRALAADYMAVLGVPRNLRGYCFLSRAIELAANDRSLVNNVTTELYPALAEEFGVSASVIEARCRYAVTTARKKGSERAFANLFRLDAGVCPTVSEFIGVIADCLRRAL